MPAEGCWDLPSETKISSSCSASSQAQLPEKFSHSPLSDPYRVLTSTDTDVIKIPPPNICFYFMASAHVALGKKKNNQPQNKQTKKKKQTTHTNSIALHCIVVLWASKHNGHGIWPLGSHRNEDSVLNAAPVPTRAAEPSSNCPLPVTWADTGWIWWSNTHLLHLAYNTTTRTALKPALDWALKSSQVCKSGLGEGNGLHNYCPPPSPQQI